MLDVIVEPKPGYAPYNCRHFFWKGYEVYSKLPHIEVALQLETIEDQLPKIAQDLPIGLVGYLVYTDGFDIADMTRQAFFAAQRKQSYTQQVHTGGDFFGGDIGLLECSSLAKGMELARDIYKKFY